MSAEIDDDTLSALLCYATRYAMGRRTYAASQVARAVIAFRGHLTVGDREAILREYRENGRDLGDDCDAQEWRRMVNALASAPAPVESRPVASDFAGFHCQECAAPVCIHIVQRLPPAEPPAAPVESAPPRPKCATCSKPATCFGRYEVSSGPGAYACDDCCGHGNEDGVCLPLPPVESAPPGECCRRAQAEVNRLREGLGCITRATEVGEARGVAAALLLSTPESLTTPAEPPTDAQDDTERLVVQAAQNAYAAGRAWGAEAMREAAMRLPARVVFTEVAGLERLKLQGADRDDWLIRTTARKVLRQLSEHLARLPLPGAKEGER